MPSAERNTDARQTIDRLPSAQDRDPYDHPVGSNYWTAVAMPMILIGISRRLTLSPLTSSGVARVDHSDAGAASGAVNVAHQIGSSVGLSVLIAIAAIGSSGLSGPELTAYRVSHAFDAGTVMLALTLMIAVLTIVPAASRQVNPDTVAAKCTA